MADGFLKRLLTRKNLILGGQLAGLALALGSKKVRGGAVDAVKAAGNALNKVDAGDGQPTVAKAVNALVDTPAVAAAAPKAKRAVKAVAPKAVPAKTKSAPKTVANAAIKRATVAVKVPAAKDAASTPASKPKAAAKPKTTRAKAKPKA